MTLTDKDILELNELCSALVDATLSDGQRARLSHWLSTSEEARQFYVRAMGLSSSLFSYAAEMQTGHPDATSSHKIFKSWKWIAGFLAVAASIALVVWIDRAQKKAPVVVEAAALAPVIDENEYVARFTAGKDWHWADGAMPVQLYSRLRKGQRVELAQGLAEITFDSGAQIVLQGPASLDVNSAWSTTLNRGTLKASLPPEAMGFSILNPTVEVVDLGTEFTMFTDASGAATDVLVLKGEVVAAPRAPADQQQIVLRAKESRRFGTSGVSTVRDSEQKFADLAQPVPIEHFLPPIGFAHWSFDEAEGGVFKADISRLPPGVADVQVQNLSEPALPIAHAKGHWNSALRFDGNLYARGAFPGLSENAPHTVAFWVKVPSDASGLNAYAMLAWGVNNKQLGSHPIHISWNRNPNEGTVGVLRTDYGRGFAIGSTSLRDGRWHHVAVVFMPRDDADAPMEVKQYIDGRLEGEGKPSPPRSDIWTYSPDKKVETANSSFWLGSRLGQNDVRMDRFSGEMDELFIADRALEPREIVRLANSNRLQF